MLHRVTGQGQRPVMARRGHYEELRCVLAVIRHGDRTPKQKMKMKVTQAGALSSCEIRSGKELCINYFTSCL